MKRRIKATGFGGLPFAALFLAGGVSLVSQPALAYVGPGAGLTAIGSVLAVVAALFLTIVGFVWYPVRRLLRKLRTPTAKTPPSAPEDGDARQ